MGGVLFVNPSNIFKVLNYQLEYRIDLLRWIDLLMDIANCNENIILLIKKVFCLGDKFDKIKYII